MRRVVVTGIGVLSPLANTAEETWRNLLLGKSGIGNIDHFDTSDYSTKFAGLVKGFDAQNYIERKEAKKMDLQRKRGAMSRFLGCAKRQRYVLNLYLFCSGVLYSIANIKY